MENSISITVCQRVGAYLRAVAHHLSLDPTNMKRTGNHLGLAGQLKIGQDRQ